MSKPKNPTLIGAITVLLIIGVGFGAGYFYRTNTSVPNHASQAITHSDSKATNTGKKSEINSEHIYEYSPPSMGVHLNKKEIEVPKGSLFPIIHLPKDRTAGFEKGQKIVFYDDKDTLLDMIGEVADLLPAKEKDYTNILVAIRALDPDLVHKFTKSYLALNTQMNVSRLPLSAIVQGDGIGDYVWELSNVEGERGVAFLKGITVKERTNEFAVVETNPMSSNDFITNPDDKLKDGQIVRVERKFYEAPPLVESDRIGMKIDAEFLKRQRDAQQAIELQQKASNPSAFSCGSSTTSNAPQDFIAKIRELSKISQ